MTHNTDLDALRGRFCPAGARRVVAKTAPAEFRVWEQAGKHAFCAAAFLGRRGKPHWRYAYTSETAREEAIRRQLDDWSKTAAQKADERARDLADAQRRHGLEVGVVLVSTWGYDQTNVNFYVVTALVGRTMVEIAPVLAATCNDWAEREAARVADGAVSQAGWAEKVTAATFEAAPGAERTRHKVQLSFPSREPWLRVEHSIARVWDGRARYASYYA